MGDQCVVLLEAGGVGLTFTPTATSLIEGKEGERMRYRKIYSVAHVIQ